MGFSFNAYRQQWQDFFQRASINYHIEQLLVEQSEGQLLVSATTEGVKHTWALVQGEFETEGVGSFVVNTRSLKQCIDMMKADVIYIGIVEDNKLQIQTEEVTERTVLLLAPTEAHIKSVDTSYVAINSNNQRRHIISLDETSEYPIPVLPPVDGKPTTDLWEQILTMEVNDLKSILRDAKTIGAKVITLRSTIKNADAIKIDFQRDDGIISRAEMIFMFDGKSVLNWKSSFVVQHLSPLIGLCEGNLHFIMTDKVNSKTKRQLGLFIVSQTETMTTCYLLGPTTM